jgi:hypothetical protein
MYQLSDRDMATILAALRYWQATVNDDERNAFPHFAEDIEPLSDAEIDLTFPAKSKMQSVREL